MRVIENEASEGVGKMKLAWKDKYGYDFEFEKIQDLIEAGLGKFIKYANPRNIYQWLKKKAKGVDIILHIGKYRIYIECRFHSHFYHYRTRWFQHSTVQRFADYPHTKYDIHIVLTNNTLVYNTPFIKSVAESQGIFIYDIQQLVQYVSNLSLSVNDYTTNPITNNPTTNNIINNVYDPLSYSRLSIDDKEQLIMEERRLECDRIRLLHGG